MSSEDDHTSADAADQEATELYDLANSLLTECKNAMNLSNLDIAIQLLREDLDQQPSLNHPHSGSFALLFSALLTKFCYTGQIEDLEEAVILCGDAFTSEEHLNSKVGILMLYANIIQIRM